LPEQPSPVAAAPLAGAVSPTTWVQLPDELTRGVASPLRRGDRLWASRPDGLWELSWWGAPVRRWREQPVRALRWWDDRTLAMVQENGQVERFDRLRRQSRVLAVLPAPVPDAAMRPALVADREADRLCVTGWTSATWAVGWTSAVLQAELPTPCSETGLGAEVALDDEQGDALAALPTTPSVRAWAWQLDGDGQLLLTRSGRVLHRHGVQARLEDGPGGNWQVAHGGGAPLWFDRRKGRFGRPDAVGGWQEVGIREVDAALATGAPIHDGGWLRHSEVWLTGDAVVVPGLGRFAPGLLAR
jgi:hypothetical protein